VTDQAADVVVVITTVANPDDAGRLAETLVRERLAACCQAMPVTSTYTWKEQLCSEAEVLLLIKAVLPEKVVARIRELHSYEVPEIIVLPVTGGHPPYLQWVRDSCSSEPER